MHTTDKRIRGRKCQERRKRLFDKQPLCVHCLAKGIVKEAVRADHKIPLFKGGPDTEANLQPLCRECDDIKTMHDKGYRVKETQPQGLDWIL